MSLSVKQKRKAWRIASKKYAKKHPEKRKRYQKEHLKELQGEK